MQHERPGVGMPLPSPFYGRAGPCPRLKRRPLVDPREPLEQKIDFRPGFRRQRGRGRALRVGGDGAAPLQDVLANREADARLLFIA